MADSRRTNVGREMVVIGGLAVVAVALILALVMKSNDDDTAVAGPSAPVAQMVEPSGSTPTGGTSGLSMERRVSGDPLALGDPAAPVVMVMFADYRCPFCAKFSRDTEPEMVKRFVDAGTLRIEWRDLPIFGDQSMQAARAGRAAAAQGKFWEFNRAVFADAPDRGHSNLTDDVLIGYARQVGVPDLDRFANQMRGTEFNAAINADVEQASSIGVPSTPAFIINGVPMLGAQPLETFVAAVTEAADRA
ncbi:disulfide bond formation protein [Mycobacterium sp. ENV421]|uniref:DsbA family protein n=1 Tax=Mycobacterium sp. ENV421 TaxID=1213407 RepID=UPI000C9B78FC|nr:thioredoxin domain-containing protein [Mycobacterium sp. ENV421]PND54608.1 disulfide bond formation protein [Mycobacterium sp. ENV421]